MFAFFGAEMFFGAHGGEHGVVDVKTLCFDVHDLAGLEAAVGTENEEKFEKFLVKWADRSYLHVLLNPRAAHLHDLCIHQ